LPKILAKIAKRKAFVGSAHSAETIKRSYIQGGLMFGLCMFFTTLMMKKLVRIPASKTALSWEFQGIPIQRGFCAYIGGSVHTEGVFWWRLIPRYHQVSYTPHKQHMYFLCVTL